MTRKPKPEPRLRVAELLLRDVEWGSVVADGAATAAPSLKRLDRPAGVAALAAHILGDHATERMIAFGLNVRHELIAHWVVGQGGPASCQVDPRCVFGPALRLMCASVIVAHNHPSGNPEPSPDDIFVTRRLVEAGRILAIPLLDSVIVGAGAVVSLRVNHHLQGIF